MRLDFLKAYDFFTGVPDSQLKPLCDFLISQYGIGPQHIIAANEGNCVALAAGYHLATGKIPVVYMQNSGIGNTVNPVVSLMNNKVYGIPCIFFIGWRGEPGISDEPQHVFQGQITSKLLNDMNIKTFVISKETLGDEVKEKLREWKTWLNSGNQVAFIVRKGALDFDGTVRYENGNTISREEIIQHITAVSGQDPVISTTGKASRELFEIRENSNQGHQYDFLTVGSMGHSSSIALGIALQCPEQKVWCIDGDGAMLMHMGAMAIIGAHAPSNLVHIVINNGSHETVGGMPTAASQIDITAIARGCGYRHVVSVNDLVSLDRELQKARDNRELFLLEVKSAIGARKNLGRPSTTPHENKKEFMRHIKNLCHKDILF